MERDDCVKWTNNVPAVGICTYSDGSMKGHGCSAWGFVLKKNGKSIGKGSGILHGGEVLVLKILSVHNSELDDGQQDEEYNNLSFKIKRAKRH